MEETHPIILKPYIRKLSIKNQFLKKEIQKMLDQNIISSSESLWSAPVVIVKKKNGKYHLCIDYWQLNNITKKDWYPLPWIDKLLDTFQNAKYFSTIDLTAEY